MNMLGRVIRAQNQPLDIRGAEMEHACFTVIDPDHRVIVMLTHDTSFFTIYRTPRAAELADGR